MSFNIKSVDIEGITHYIIHEEKYDHILLFPITINV